MLGRYPEANSTELEQGSVHPLSLSRLEAAFGRVATVNVTDLEMFVELRRAGPADDLLTVLYDARLGDWHESEGRAGSLLHYRAGELYGYLACKDEYQAAHHEPLIADDPDAYQVAVGTVQTSYYPGWSHLPAWAMEKTREIDTTGHDVLSILNAAFTDKIHDQIIAISDTDAEPDEITTTSFYRGMIDAAIFTDVYTCFRNNQIPYHDKSSVIAPLFDAGLYPNFVNIAEHDSSYKMQTLSLSQSDTIHTVLDKLAPQKKDVGWWSITVADVTVTMLGIRQMMQTGANEFTAYQRLGVMQEDVLLPRMANEGFVHFLGYFPGEVTFQSFNGKRTPSMKAIEGRARGVYVPDNHAGRAT